MLRDIVSNEWATIIIVICILLLAIAKFIFANRFNDFLVSIGNSKYLKIYAREQKFIDQFDGLLFANLVLSASLFGFLGYNTFSHDTLDFNITLFLKIVTAVGSLILIKILLERLIASLFEIDALIDSYIFQKTNYKNYIGLIFLVSNILLWFSLTPSKILIYIIIGIIALVNVIGIIISFSIYQKVILRNLFYFILYLCALEIAPYIILYKTLKN